jgi:hypothetical protein
MSGIHTSAALLDMKASQAPNKLAMQDWLRYLGLDPEQLRIKSFVHMLLSMSMQIWSCLCERFADDEKKALSVFLSRK